MTANKAPRIPVILDTDIGGDIDDTWALAMMLKCPELDVKLVVSDTGDAVYRSKLIAKMLEVAGRTDIPVGMGINFDQKKERMRQAQWVEDYDLSKYPGTVHQDGIGAIIDTIMNSPRPVTLICIGPVPNIGKALQREPRITQNARFVGMHGSIRVGYGGSKEISRECNVVNHTPACQEAFTAPWDMTITPLDTCGLVVLKGEKYKAVEQCRDPMIQALMENYRYWSLAYTGKEPAGTSSVLFDTVAVYLAFADDLLMMEKLPIRVTVEGYTVIDPAAKVIHCATAWKDLGAFEDLLVQRLIS